jgi:hypothetical protein
LDWEPLDHKVKLEIPRPTEDTSNLSIYEFGNNSIIIEAEYETSPYTEYKYYKKNPLNPVLQKYRNQVPKIRMTSVATRARKKKTMMAAPCMPKIYRGRKSSIGFSMWAYRIEEGKEEQEEAPEIGAVTENLY